ncbi:M20 family metallo-hydrolase [Halorussus halophilus]|uniref:M20 family metallo-hydrolase n=1 Tax=Halorussus halophilus TaxID=2650975 RepID=UPI0013019270|nr:M20 family metallo-hydrolase [Halorussus halophilus]
MEVQQTRLRNDVETNGEFGAVGVDDGHGRTVLTGTEADRRARRYFVERLEDAELDVRIDAVGNVVGRWTPDSADPEAAPVAAGSHLDSVPEGGIFDGPLGVYAALEAVRAMQDAEQDADFEPTRPVEVVSFTEEEGQRFGGGLVGSAVAAGDMSVEEALAIEDDGESLHEALESIGFLGDGRLDASEWDAWFELHIEQAERLERATVPAGVVTTITGLSRCHVEIQGEANHAGATSMDERTDALAAASEFVGDVERAANEVVASDAESAVATVGKLDVTPNAPNVIAGKVELTIDVRDVSHDAIHRLIDRAHASLQRLETDRGVETTIEHPWDRAPVPMSERCRDALHESGASAGIETLNLHSGAAHDTMHVAEATDAALLFAPSRDGISHNPMEWTDWANCAAATQVLAGAMARLASR